MLNLRYWWFMSYSPHGFTNSEFFRGFLKQSIWFLLVWFVVTFFFRIIGLAIEFVKIPNSWDHVMNNSLLLFRLLLHLFLELVSKELNHFGVIAGLFRQIGGHSSSFVLFCSFWRLFTTKMIKSVKVFPFSFWKIITKNFFYFIKFKPPA